MGSLTCIRHISMTLKYIRITCYIVLLVIETVKFEYNGAFLI